MDEENSKGNRVRETGLRPRPKLIGSRDGEKRREIENGHNGRLEHFLFVSDSRLYLIFLVASFCVL